MADIYINFNDIYVFFRNNEMNICLTRSYWGVCFGRFPAQSQKQQKLSAAALLTVVGHK